MLYGSQKRKTVSEIEKIPVENAVRKYRRLIDLSQEELGDMIGVHSSMIYKIERRLVAPKITTVIKLAEALDIPVNELFYAPQKDVQ